MDRFTFTTTLIPLNEKNIKGRYFTDNKKLRTNINKLNKRVDTLGVVYGELRENDWESSIDTSLSKVSHTISNIRIKNDNVIGDITVLNTYWGKELRETYEYVLFRPSYTGLIFPDGKVRLDKIFTFNAYCVDIDSFTPSDDVVFRRFEKIEYLNEKYGWL